MNKTYENHRFSRKSQGLSINVIIIVAIALIVLVVLIAIFTGRLGSFITGVDTANSCSSSCEAIGKNTPSDVAAGSCSGQFIPGKFSDGYSNGCCCT